MFRAPPPGIYPPEDILERKRNYSMIAYFKRSIEGDQQILDIGDTFIHARDSEYVQAFFTAVVSHHWVLGTIKKKFDCLFEHFYIVVDDDNEEFMDGEFVLKQMFYSGLPKRAYWMLCITDILGQFGFDALPGCPCIFRKKAGYSDLYILVWVDDVFIAGASRKSVEITVAQIENALKEYIPSYPQPKIWPKVENAENGASIRCDMYIEKLLEDSEVVAHEDFAYEHDYALLPSQFRTVMGETRSSGLNQVLVNFLFRSFYERCVWSLTYLASHTRPDISLVTAILSNTDPEDVNVERWKMLLQVLHYLKSTKHMKIEFRLTENPRFTAYYDFYFNEDEPGFQILGFCFSFGSSLLKWSTEVRNPVSSARDAYFNPNNRLGIMKTVVTKIEKIKPLLVQLGLPSTGTGILYTSDKEARSTYYADSEQHKEEREYIKKFEIKDDFAIKYVDPKENLARMFTRLLSAHELRQEPFSTYLPGFQGS